jgi:hypothetical protein
MGMLTAAAVQMGRLVVEVWLAVCLNDGIIKLAEWTSMILCASFISASA